MCHVNIHRTTHLLHGQFARGALVQALANTTTQQVTQRRHVIVAMDATPAADFEVNHSQCFLRDAEASFDRPTTEGHTQQPAERDTTTSDDSVGPKVHHLASSHIASHDQGLLSTGQFVFRLPPHAQPFDLPDLGAVLGIFDPIRLPRLLLKLRRVLHQVAYFAGRSLASDSRSLFRPTSARLGRCFANHVRPGGPNVRIARYFRDIRLLAIVQSIEEFAVATVQFVEGPNRDSDTIAPSAVDQIQRDLRLRLKLDVVGDVVFFRRAASWQEARSKSNSPT